MAIKAGMYAYRFNGSAMKSMKEFHLIGVGVLELKNGDVKGYHTSSITPLTGSNAKIDVTRFVWDGTYGLRDPNPLGPDDLEAKITFTSVGKVPVQKLEGTFSLVQADANRVWLISTGTTNLTPVGDEDEVVSGEAVWIRSA